MTAKYFELVLANQSWTAKIVDFFGTKTSISRNGHFLHWNAWKTVSVHYWEGASVGAGRKSGPKA